MRAILLSSLLIISCSSSNSGCPSPFKSCGKICTSVDVDPANCGACGNACAAGQRCMAGTCMLSCPDGSMQCGTTCIAVATDNANCGTCNNACPAGQVCSAGKCGDTCASGYTDCTGYCADTANDSQNCGACGKVCPAGQRCDSGACAGNCATGRTGCNGACVDVMSDPSNCGGCGMACLAGEQCQSGTCACGLGTLTLGKTQSCAVRTDGTVLCTGALFYNPRYGQGSRTPLPLPELGMVKQLDAGGNYLCALKADGTVWCEGVNDQGQLGAGDLLPRPSPSPSQVRLDNTPTYLTGVAQISAGYSHACALKTNGEIWCWGSGESGELGNHLVANSPLAVQAVLPAALTGVTQVAAGQYHTCVLAGDKTVWCWGDNQLGQCGLGNLVFPQPTPHPVIGLANVTAVVSEVDHTCAIKSDQSVSCWGHNQKDQCGIDHNLSQDSIVSPNPVALTNVAEVGVGSAHTCARKLDGSVWCWGRNVKGELGQGTDEPSVVGERDKTDHPSPSPVAVLTLSGAPLVADSLAVSHTHSCAVVGPTQHPWCWGNNVKGQSALSTAVGKLAAPIVSCGF